MRKPSCRGLDDALLHSLSSAVSAESATDEAVQEYDDRTADGFYVSCYLYWFTIYRQITLKAGKKAARKGWRRRGKQAHES